LSVNARFNLMIDGGAAVTRRILAALALCWLASGALAATLGGVTLPDTYAVDGRILQLNGIGLRTYSIFRVRIYVAGLYLVRPSHDANAIIASPDPKVVRLLFIHGGSKAEVQKHYLEGQAHDCGDGGCDPADQSDFERLLAVVPAVESGDTTTFVFANNGFKVLANDRLIGEFANPDLAHHMLDGFIGSHPPTRALRSQLLGLPPD
jgi:hypothetical protein